MNRRAHSLIAQLGLLPHPEGGYFREVFRSTALVKPADGRPPRSSVTSIHFLLTRGDFSRWHVVRSDEIWHHAEGDPLELLVIEPASLTLSSKVLGPAGEGREPIHVVPANYWQAARPLGDYTLVGCTVGPGFEFEDFALLRDDVTAVSDLQEVFPDLLMLL